MKTPKITILGIILLLSAITVSFIGCSTRQVYQSTADIVPTASDALNINTATADQLEKLPHIGRKTAETIVQFREENGPFRRAENLLQIRGVSEKRFLELRQFLKAE